MTIWVILFNTDFTLSIYRGKAEHRDQCIFGLILYIRRQFGILLLITMLYKLSHEL